MTVFEVLICAFTGYLIGSFQTSYIIGKIIKGIDIRKFGSKNAGASNALITFGWKYGIITVAFDILKTTIAILIIRNYVNDNLVFSYLTACFVIIGHIFPFYMKFKGGKGLACFLGMVLTLDIKIGIILIIILIFITIITDFIVWGTIVITGIYPIFKSLTEFNISIIVILTSIFLLIFYKHRINIKRIIRKEEIGLKSIFTKEAN